MVAFVFKRFEINITRFYGNFFTKFLRNLYENINLSFG
jgi:hypothetical protein